MSSANPASSPPAQRPLWIVLAGAAIVVAVLLAYAPIRHNQFIWDDDAYITDNANLRSAQGLNRIWLDPMGAPQYYPLVHTTFWIEHQLWGLNPRGYHAVNIALHLLASLLLWRALERLGLGRAPAAPGACDAPPPPAPLSAAFSFPWFIAAVFALHPVCVESVAWATERKNVLMAAFYMLAFHAFIRFAALDHDAPPPAAARRPWRWYALALLFFVGAMLSKTVACSFGVAMGVLIAWKRGRTRWADLWPLAPFLLIGAALGLLTAWLERHHVGAMGAEWDLSFAQRSLIAGRALWFYWEQILWPLDVTFVYERWPIDTRSITQWLYPVAAVAFVAALWLGRRLLGRGPIAAVAFFGLTIFPALGFVNIYPMRYTWAADHYQYVASIGLIALSAGLARAALQRLGTPGSHLLRVATPVALLSLGAITHAHVQNYRDLKTLWTSVLKENPTSAIAGNNLGLILMGEGKPGEAEALFRGALAASPGHYEAHNNLAYLLAQRGDVAEALRHLRLAVEAKPDYADAQNNLGLLLAQRGELEEAASHLRQAVKAEPRLTDAWRNLGVAAMQLGRPDEAEQALTRALELAPRDAVAMAQRACALRAMGRTAEAVAWFKRAMEIMPRDPVLRQELALTLLAQNSPAPLANATQPASPATRPR